MSTKNSSFDIEIPDEYHLLIMMAIIHKFGVRRFITHFIHVIYTYIDKIDQISRCFASAHTNSEYAVGNVKGKQLITGANAPVINSSFQDNVVMNISVKIFSFVWKPAAWTCPPSQYFLHMKETSIPVSSLEYMEYLH